MFNFLRIVGSLEIVIEVELKH